MLSAILLAIGLNLGSNTAEPKTPSGVTVSLRMKSTSGSCQPACSPPGWKPGVASSRHRSYRLVGQFSGTLNLPIRTRAELALRGTGSAVLSIDGEVVLEGALGTDLQTKQLRLNKGERSVRLEWTPPCEGPAWIRLLWDGRDFTLEPIPTQQLTATEPTTTSNTGSI